MSSDRLAVQEEAVLALGDLAYGSQKTKGDICATGAVPLLVTLLRSDQPAVQRVVAATLASLALASQHKRDVIIAAGASPLLVALPRSDTAVQVSVASALGIWQLALRRSRMKSLQQGLCLCLLPG